MLLSKEITAVILKMEAEVASVCWEIRARMIVFTQTLATCTFSYQSEDDESLETKQNTEAHRRGEGTSRTGENEHRVRLSNVNQ